MKRTIWTVLALGVVVAMLLAACAPAQPAPTPTPAAKTAPPAGAQATPTAAPAKAAAPAATQPATKPAATPIKLGITDALTGPAASYGKRNENAFLLRIKEINAAGGVNGRPIETVSIDSMCDDTKAVTAIKKLIEEEKVLAILGLACSTHVTAANPIIAQPGVPVFPLGTLASITQMGNKWVFRPSIRLDVVTEKEIVFLQQKGVVLRLGEFE